MKNKFFYVLYLTFFLIVLFYFSKINLEIFIPALKKFDFSEYDKLLSLMMLILIGGLIGFEVLVKQFKRRGSWIINVNRIIIFGVPLSILSLHSIVYYLPLSIGNPILSEYSLFISRIFLGYIVITSFEKNED